MDYLKRAVELSQASLDAGEFPAGAVLVTATGNVYESGPSVPHNHGEMMVIDAAVAAEGAPLVGAKIFASMEPCLMCASKMYWSGVVEGEYVIAKSDTKPEYAYENGENISQTAATFYKPVTLTQKADLLEDALRVYRAWVKKIEG